MYGLFARLSISYLRGRRAAGRFMVGGVWALGLPAVQRRNLRWFWVDGLFASASDNIALTYLVLYALAAGASRAQIGMMSSLVSLGGALLLLPGALLVENFGQRKRVTLLTGGVGGRLVLLVLAFLPLFFIGPPLITAIVILAVVREAFVNLGYPAWMSLTADLIPIAGRGRFFGARNFGMGLAGIGALLLAGEIITRSGSSLSGYQIAFGLAFVLGGLSTYSFSRLKDSGSGLAIGQRGWLHVPELIANLRAAPVFVSLCATAALWNFSLNISGPFFSVYLVQELKGSPTMVALAGAIFTVTALSAQARMGGLMDRWGARRLQLTASFLIWFVPLLLIFATRPWHMLLINLIAGVMWAAYNLASFNLLLIITPQAQRARFAALYQLLVTISLAAGAAVGSLIITWGGFLSVFIASSVMRLIASFLFARFVPPQAGQSSDD